MTDVVDLDLSNLENGCFSLSLDVMAQGSAHACHQLADPERLIDKVVGAQVQRLNFLDIPVAGREYDNRYFRPFAYPPNELFPVPVRQTEVEHDDVGPLASDLTNGFLGGGRSRDLVGVGCQRRLEK